MKRIIVCCDGTWNADDTQTHDTYTQLAQLCSDDIKATCSLVLYKPENLAPFFSGGQFAGLPVLE